MTRNYAGTLEIVPSSGGRVGAIALLCVAMACTEPMGMGPVDPDGPPTRAPRALSVNTISDLGWGSSLLVSHFALGVNDSLATVGAATNASNVTRAVRSTIGSSSVTDMSPTVTESGASYAIANNGSIAGFNWVGGAERGFYYNAATTGAFRGYQLVDATRRSVVNDINDAGRDALFAGWIEPTAGSGGVRGFFKDLNGNAEVLIPLLPGGSWNVVTKISNTPRVVGYSEATGGIVRAFIVNTLTRTPTVQQLPLAAGCSNSVAWSVNDNATPIVVGYCDNGQGNIRAVRWVGGVVTDLGDFGGGNSVALDVNNAGDIVGYAMNASGDWRPFIMRAGSATLDELASLGAGSNWGIATSVSNRAGDGSVRVVGYAEDPNSVDRARPVSWIAN